MNTLENAPLNEGIRILVKRGRSRERGTIKLILGDAVWYHREDDGRYLCAPRADCERKRWQR